MDIHYEGGIDIGEIASGELDGACNAEFSGLAYIKLFRSFGVNLFTPCGGTEYLEKAIDGLGIGKDYTINQLNELGVTTETIAALERVFLYAYEHEYHYESFIGGSYSGPPEI